jgi:hypothetical protein
MPEVSARCKFPHRTNADGTIDSICPRCYVTIASSTWEAELEGMEAVHVCEPGLLSYYEEQRRTLPSQDHQRPARKRNAIPIVAQVRPISTTAASPK